MTLPCDPDFSDVVLLVNFDSGFTDDSSYGHTVSLNGSPSIDTSVKKFGAGSQLYSAFAAQYSYCADAVEFDFATADFTIELWANLVSIGGVVTLISKYSGLNHDPYLIQVSAAGVVTFSGQDSGGSAAYSVSSPAASLVVGAWTAIAVQRSGSTFEMFIDGVSVGTATFAGTLGTNTSNITMGGGGSGNVNIDEVRFTNGLARYAGNYTPATMAFGVVCVPATVPSVVGLTQTAAITAIGSASFTVGTLSGGASPTVPVGDVISQTPAGGSSGFLGGLVDIVVSVGTASGPCDPYYQDNVLLLHFEGGFEDSSPKLNIPAPVGSPAYAIEGTTVKFGTGAGVATAASNAQLTVPDAPWFNFSTGEWTLEGWFYFDNASPDSAGVFDKIGFTSIYPFQATLAPTGAINANGADNSGTTLYSLSTGTGTFSVQAWHHVVLQRSSDTFALYIDGQYLAHQAVPGAVLGSNSVPVHIGGFGGTPGQWITDEVRFTKGVARYPLSNFTPPTQPFPNYDCSVVVVPDVVGEMQAAAESDIVSAGLVVGTETTASDAAPIGEVIAQSPVGGSTAAAGDPVDLTISSGPADAIIPDLINTALTLAVATLDAAGPFDLGTVGYASDVLINSGNIISQSPVGGTPAAFHTAVNVVVSTGRAGLVVPNLIGLTPVDADDLLVTIGLVTNTVTYAPSLLAPAGVILAQNPFAGTPVGYGALVSYVVSSGPPVPDKIFDFEATVISQYANSPTLLQLVESMNDYIDQGQNFANFYSFVWNVDTAQGFGLDVWGKIVNVSRLLQIPTDVEFVGFQDGTGPGVGTDVQPFSADGVWYTSVAATEGYLLQDEPYRQLILTKALANIVNTTVPAFNQLLQNLFPGRGNPYVTTSGQMAMTFWFDFALTGIELAILQQSGAVPVPPGVSFTIVTP